ncbi:transcription termination/antitermination protein NusG [Microvirga sp. GCM10011540]|uniref:transcription termination/antitermination protein NusG n=1 Tax=Microvirga sp. GCM10011540 TaxID=3317338 RepID=UPI003620D1C3
MTNELHRLQLSANPGPVHYARARIIDHTPPETFEGLTWFVVVCNPKCERRAQLGLRRAGYQTYLPVERKYIERSRKLVETENPLLPRYLFVGLKGYGEKEGQDFYKLRGVDGVESLVRNDGSPLVVQAAKAKDGETSFPRPLSRLREREVAGDFDHIKKAEEEKARKKALRAKCRPGARVSLLTGPMTGLQAIVQRVQSGGRIEVLLEFLGGVTKAKLKLDEVDLLEAAE